MSINPLFSSQVLKAALSATFVTETYGGKESTPETVIKAIKAKAVKRSKDGVFSLKNSLTCTDLRFASGGERMVPDRRFAARFPMLFSMTRPLPISTMPTKNLALA